MVGGGDLCSRWSAQLPLAPWSMVCPAPGRAAKFGERGERVEEGNSNSTSSWTPSSPAQKPPQAWAGQLAAGTTPGQGPRDAVRVAGWCRQNEGAGHPPPAGTEGSRVLHAKPHDSGGPLRPPALTRVTTTHSFSPATVGPGQEPLVTRVLPRLGRGVGAQGGQWAQFHRAVCHGICQGPRSPAGSRGLGAKGRSPASFLETVGYPAGF